MSCQTRQAFCQRTVLQGTSGVDTFDAVFGQSAIFSHARTESNGPELDPNSAGMLVMWVLHQVFVELKVSLKLTFLALDFSQTSADTRSALHLMLQY